MVQGSPPAGSHIPIWWLWDFEGVLLQTADEVVEELPHGFVLFRECDFRQKTDSLPVPL